jgi:elongation factor P
MHTENYEQTFLNGDVVKTPELLNDGQAVEILVHAETGEVLSCDLPQFVELKITYTEPGVKGDTATNTFKPATMETGAIIKVPLFIGEGEKIRIDTKTGEYVERVK